jgi:hypothetical protein
MKTTLVGDYPDFAMASRVAAELLIAGCAKAEVSVVGREEIEDGARFAFAGALAMCMSGASERDFEARLVAGLASLCVPPRAAERHAASMAHGGGLVAVHADSERAQRAEAVMHRYGPTERYVVGTVPLGRATHASVPGRYPCPA